MNETTILNNLWAILKKGIIKKSEFVPLVDDLCNIIKIDSSSLDQIPHYATLEDFFEKEKKFIEHISTKDDKLLIWTESIYNNIWRLFYYLGLGSIRDVTVKQKRIDVEVFLNMIPHSYQNESTESFTKRKDNHVHNLAESGIEIIQRKYSNGYSPKDTEETKENYVKYLSHFFTLDHISWTTRNDCLWTLSFSIPKNSSLLFDLEEINDEEKNSDTLTTKEHKNLTQVIKEFYFLYDPKLSSIDDNLKYDLSVHYLYDLCEIFNISNDFTKTFKGVYLKNKSKNQELKAKKDAIIDEIDYDFIFKRISEISDKLENTFGSRFYLDILDIKFSKNLTFSAIFNCHNFYAIESETKDNNFFDIVHTEDDHYDSFICFNENNQSAFNEICSTFGLTILDLAIDYNTKKIKKINFYCDNLSKLLQNL